MLDNVTIIEKEQLINETAKFKEKGYRFVAVTCEKEGEEYEITYHFDSNYTMKHLRIFVKLDDMLSSISHIYPSAFLIENEYQDLYGLKFEDLIIDYKGNLYLTPDGPTAPLSK